jgi:glycosyltransferase involved in cell wall biosynthesis
MLTGKSSHKLRILYCDTDKVWRGGQEQLFGLMTGMKARGHVVWLAADKSSALFQRASEAGMTAVGLHQWNEVSPSAFLRIWNILRTEPFDVVHSNTPKSLFAAGLAAKMAGTPAVFCSRRVDFPLRSQLSAWKYNWTTDRILTVSSSIKETLTRAGVKSSKVEIVYEGVDLAWIDEQSAPPMIQPDQELVVGTVAHMSPEKGHADLLEAIHLLRPRFPASHFYFVGDGKLKMDLVQRAERLQVDENITFTGFRSDSEALMKQFGIFCLPSLSEGLSSAILAAMANRLPVVSTSVGGIPELVLDGVTGLLVPPRDPGRLAAALEKLLGDSDLRRKMGEAGRRRIEEHFTLEQKLSCTEKSYLRLLRTKGIR